MNSTKPWHISPLADLCLYHWSWPLGLLIYYFFGMTTLAFFLVPLAFFHRHVTFLPAYESKKSQKLSLKKVALFPFLCFFLFTAIVSIGFFETTPLIKTYYQKTFYFISYIVGFWNIWHIISQRYGIFRLYSRLLPESEGQTSVPRWVDKIFIYSWLPLFVWWIFRNKLPFFEGTFFNSDTLGESSTSQQMGILIFAILGAFFFLYWELFKSSSRHPARVSLMISTLILFSLFSFFGLSVAYGILLFAHSVEYLAFVGKSSSKKLSLGRTQLFTTLFLLLAFSVYAGSASTKHLEKSLVPIISTWIIFQSMMHFYWDGILWKDRSIKTGQLEAAASFHMSPSKRQKSAKGTTE